MKIKLAYEELWAYTDNIEVTEEEYQKLVEGELPGRIWELCNCGKMNMDDNFSVVKLED